MADSGILSAIEPSTPVGIAAPIILWSKAQPMFALNDSAASGSDADAIHDMRVASRRTREALSIFEPLYRDEEYAWAERTMKRVTRALGPVRDADVFIEEFGCLMGDLPGEDTKRALAYLIGYVAGDRAMRLRTMQKNLHRLDLANRRPRFERALHEFRRSAEVQMQLDEFAASVMPARLDAVLCHLPAALEREAGLEQHQMRIAIKHLRYAVETFRSIYDEEFKPLHKLLTDMQDTLGNLHDRDVFVALARDAEEQADASSAEVSAEALDRVINALCSERDRFFDRFIELMRENPVESIRASILEPVGAYLPEAEAPEPAAPEAEAPEVVPVMVETAVVAVEPEAAAEVEAVPAPEVMHEEPEALVEEPEALAEEPMELMGEPEALAEEPEVPEIPLAQTEMPLFGGGAPGQAETEAEAAARVREVDRQGFEAESLEAGQPEEELAEETEQPMATEPLEAEELETELIAVEQPEAAAEAEPLSAEPPSPMAGFMPAAAAVTEPEVAEPQAGAPEAEQVEKEPEAPEPMPRPATSGERTAPEITPEAISAARQRLQRTVESMQRTRTQWPSESAPQPSEPIETHDLETEAEHEPAAEEPEPEAQAEESTRWPGAQSEAEEEVTPLWEPEPQGEQGAEQAEGKSAKPKSRGFSLPWRRKE